MSFHHLLQLSLSLKRHSYNKDSTKTSSFQLNHSHGTNKKTRIETKIQPRDLIKNSETKNTNKEGVEN